MLLLSSAASAKPRSVSESLAQWSPGKRIVVVLNTGEKITGRLGAVESDRFTLEPDTPGGAQRTLRFADVQSVKTRMTTARKWAIAGGVYAAVTLLFARTVGG